MLNPQVVPIVSGNSDIVYAPISCFQQWFDEKSFPTTFQYGQKPVPVQVQPHPDQKEQYMMTESLQKKLSIQDDQQHHIDKRDSILHAGPVVGIYTAGITSHPQHPFGERTKMFAKFLMAASHTGVTCFVFGANHIDWERKTITGYLYKKSGWSRALLPFPNIVYDRLPNRRIEELPVSIETKQKLQNEGAIWFNPGFFDKWKVYEKLITDPSVQSYQPKTILSPDHDDIERLLNRYRNLYLKPTNGSLGNGIQQIIKQKYDPYFYIRFRSQESNRLRRYTSLKRLLRKQFPRGTDGYMAQTRDSSPQLERKSN
jgi:hypothetical protein